MHNKLHNKKTILCVNQAVLGVMRKEHLTVQKPLAPGPASYQENDQSSTKRVNLLHQKSCMVTLTTIYFNALLICRKASTRNPVANTTSGCAADWVRAGQARELEERNLMKFNNGRYWVLHLGWISSLQQHGWGVDLLRGMPVKKDLVVLGWNLCNLEMHKKYRKHIGGCKNHLQRHLPVWHHESPR